MGEAVMVDERRQPEAIAEAATEAARPLQPNLSDEQVFKQVKFSVKNARDCGAASAVGAGTVAISLLIGGGQVTLDAFYVLLIAQGVLMVVALFFAMASASMMGREFSRLGAAGLFIAAVAISLVGSLLSSQMRQHGSNTGSLSWWLLLGLAGVGALLGLIIRRFAESLLDELADEGWRQRVAPLVSKEEEAIAEMWRMGGLLQDAHQPAPPVPGESGEHARG
jgi:hypothetical protein